VLHAVRSLPHAIRRLPHANIVACTLIQAGTVCTLFVFENNILLPVLKVKMRVMKCFLDLQKKNTHNTLFTRLLVPIRSMLKLAS
jgi:hypothetical protein